MNFRTQYSSPAALPVVLAAALLTALSCLPAPFAKAGEPTKTSVGTETKSSQLAVDPAVAAGRTSAHCRRRKSDALGACHFCRREGRGAAPAS